MASHKGHRLFQSRISTGGGRVQELQDIQEQLPMGPEERPEEGQVIIACILQMRLTLCQDGLGPSADQGLDRLPLLLWGSLACQPLTMWPSSATRASVCS